MTYPGFQGKVGRTVADSESWWPERKRATGAPNIVIVLLDDMGYSDVGPFGSEIDTPHLDRLARTGLRLSNYHTASVCSPARAALMTGLNPHHAGFGSVASTDPGFPGYAMEISANVPTLAEILRAQGYATFAAGKWHLTLDSRMHQGADQSSWPCQRGFDRYYGVLEGMTNLHHPHRLVVDNSPLEVDRYPEGYYLPDDVTDHAISMIKGLRAHEPEKPFFLYVAHNAVHGPLHAKPGDINKYRGRYQGGWDRLREERFARQIAAGLFPAGSIMAPRNYEAGLDVSAWDELPESDRALFARYQEVYAAMVDNVDQNLGRLLSVIEAYGESDNTIVIYTSDNGGTAEGGGRGSRSYFKQFIRNPRVAQLWDLDVPRDPELIGGPRVLAHYPRGWGMASNTPFRLYKGQTHAGGVRVPFVISWPKGIQGEAAGAIRTEYQYVTDLLPTLLECAGVSRPDERWGQAAPPVDGVSFADGLSNPIAPSRHREQYSEITGNRSFYQDGWKLVTLHRPRTPYDDSEWQLYDIRTDPTETKDLARDLPDKVRQLSEAWERAAWGNQVFPMDDGTGYLSLARPPENDIYTQPVTLLAGTPTMERYRSSKLIAFRSFEMVVRFTTAPEDEGVLVAHGDQGGGYSLYVENGRLWFAYNEYGLMKEVDGREVGAGDHELRLDAQAIEDFCWDFRLFLDGVQVGQLQKAQMLLGMAPFQGIGVGIDRGSPVSWSVYERHGPFPFSGRLDWVRYVPGELADYDPATIMRALREAGRTYE